MGAENQQAFRRHKPQHLLIMFLPEAKIQIKRAQPTRLEPFFFRRVSALFHRVAPLAETLPVRSRIAIDKLIDIGIQPGITIPNGQDITGIGKGC